MCSEGGGEGSLADLTTRGCLVCARTKCVWMLLLVMALAALAGPADAEVLTPPFFNLAEKRRITATATCGEDTQGPELYCKLVGANADRDVNLNLIQGQSCDFCDSEDAVKKHPAEYAVDGSGTWWQSPPLSRGIQYNEVNLTIDLGQEFHVAYIFIRMGNSPRPAIWVLERSTDNGKTYKPWQYFADSPSECEALFGPETLQPITRDDSVICNTEFSKIVPLEDGEIVVSFLKGRPSANDFFNSSILQEFTRATNIRLRFIRTKTLLGHLMSVARQDPSVTRRYFYSIKDISIGGRCVCNGHAENCDIIDPNDEYKLLCRCKHNTCGDNCESCCPGFEQKKWRQSKHYELFECEPCNCHGHSDKCKYEEEVDEKHLSVDIHGKYEGGGKCLDCRHNTMGINCDRCKPKFYRPYNKPLNATDVCQPCHCDFWYSTGNCAEGSGKCECKANFTAPNCDKCSDGFYGYPECKQCECFNNGTRGSKCEPDGGVCPCKQAYAGTFCRECSEGYFGYPDCEACDCNPVGMQSEGCHNVTGQCTCKINFGGRKCDQCYDGYYSYPDCHLCNCDKRGTLPGICNRGTGQCLCREGYGGERCDMCLPGYHGYPNCRSCNCSEVGSTSSTCDASGKCPCLSNFAGRACDQCKPGYYRFPECLSCSCDPHGTVGVSCNANGHCQCRDNFEGARCDRCKEGLYNFPICEACDCYPAGTISTFAGCGSLPLGELCQCKANVEGRTCKECRPTYWNLRDYHREGCEACDCHLPGVMGGIDVCNTKTGQCLCKPSVGSRRCDSCKDGKFNLLEDNLFGCTDCGCDIGGAVNGVCDKNSGQCTCHPRILGRTCNEPIPMHFFPTLHQHQYEAEDGRSSERTVRYGFDDKVFQNFSGKGYASFSTNQDEIWYNVIIDKPSVYHMVLRYINPGPDSIIADIIITPESHSDPQQSFKVLFKATNGTPSFVTVAGATNTLLSPFVMDPGTWTVNIKSKSSQPLLLDYFVLLPEAYYEAGILVKSVSEPCVTGNQTLCQQYQYPKITGCDVVHGEGGFIAGVNREPLKEYYDNQKHIAEAGLVRLPMLTNTQPELHLDMTVAEAGPHVIIINYLTPPNVSNSTRLLLEVSSQETRHLGRAILHSCPYTTACRQAVIDGDGRVIPFSLDSNFIRIALKADGEANTAIDCVVAVPYEDWSLDYIQPKPVCIRSDGKCLHANYPTLIGSKKIKIEVDQESKVSTPRPPMIADNSSDLIYFDYTNPTIDIKGKVPSPGPYVFVLHFYQPDHPEFSIDAVIQNGEFYEAKLPVHHCPSFSGCRAVIRQADGNNRFLLTENFVLTLKQPNRKGLWIDYLLVVPADQYDDEKMKQEDLDQTGVFISQCGQNHFHIDTHTQGFCREAVFSLTSAYNSGALPCSCSVEGSTSFHCDKFGGQCPCKTNVIGRQCTECRTGYYGFPNCKKCDCPENTVCDTEGRCQCAPNIKGAKCDECEVNTYAFDPYFGCNDCNCSPAGVINGSLQCDKENGSCSCKPNIVGRQCDVCQGGYWGYPYCERCDCDERGSQPQICDQSTAHCFCKTNVEGLACDVCVDGTFDIQADNVDGCTKCYCFGRTTRCSSAGLYRTQITGMEDWQIATIASYQPTVVITPIDSAPQPLEEGIGVDLAQKEKQVVYFKAPEKYYGNMLTAYGGNLNYTIFYTVRLFGNAVPGPDVILHGAAVDIDLLHFSVEQPAATIEFKNTLPILERNFQLPNGLTATREQLMQVLQNLDAIYIRATYWETSNTSRLLKVSLDTAQEHYNPKYGVAHAVERCQCPSGYQGLSCEDCAPGYYRVQSGPYEGRCLRCQCNNHSNNCDVLTGICKDCQHNTAGDHCEMCAVGYFGNATEGPCDICPCPLPIPSNNFATGCMANPDDTRGSSRWYISCDCKPGYFGALCESCSPGFYGKPEIQGDYCKPCVCNNNIDPSDANSCDSVSGQCMTCLNNTSGESCEYCAPGFYGDAITRKNCQSCVCDKCGTEKCGNYSGVCECYPNVEGEKCDRCAPDHYGFSTCKGCTLCECGAASESTQCDDTTGQCRCKPGVTGRTCDRCKPGYWNYGPEGCVSCGCNTEYSVGVGCNAATGQCECLPGVIGEKCDHCPYRWVFKDDEGCFKCDACTHGLLNVTDELAGIIDPLRSDFETVAASHYTKQRLAYVSERVDDLSPQVKKNLDSERVDLKPITALVQKLSEDAKQHERAGEYKVERAEQTAPKGNAVRQESLQLQKLMAEAVDKAHFTVREINNITFSLEAGSGPQIDYFIRGGEELLKEIGESDFTEPLDEAKKSLLKAEELKKNITSNAAEPVFNHTRLLEELHKQLAEFDSELEDTRNNSESALTKASESQKLTYKNKNDNVVGKVNSVKELDLKARKELEDVKDLLLNISNLISIAEKEFHDIESDAKRVEVASNKVNKTITEQKLDELGDVVWSAKIHADKLKEMAVKLDHQLSGFRSSSYKALGAANAYSDIMNATQEALKAAQEAQSAASNAADMLKGLGDRTDKSEKRSRGLLKNARDLLDNAQLKLSPTLQTAIRSVDGVQDLISSGQKVYSEVEKSLAVYRPVPSGATVKKARQDSETGQESASDAILGIADILKELPEQSKTSKQVPKNLGDARTSVSQARNQLDSVPDLHRLETQMNNVSLRHKSLNETVTKARDDIEKLRQKVAEARENTNRIKLGVRFYPNTTLELRIPDNMPQHTTSERISVYFKTKVPNGFILYLGNEKGTNNLPRTDDYLALVIENGYPVLSLDLGWGPQRVISDKNVADGNWYQALIERTVKSARLTIREEKPNKDVAIHTKEEVIKGTQLILDVDPKHSKLFVGGYPATFRMQDDIKEATFDGTMEDLMIGNTPVSLWNSVDALNNRNGDYERSQLKNQNLNTGYRFNGSGHVVLSTTTHSNLQEELSSVQFKFKTNAYSGLLFLIGNDQQQYLSVEIRDGKILFKFDLGDGPASILSKNAYNDGMWHTVEATRQKNTGLLRVDEGEQQTVVSRTSKERMMVPKEMYFGGYPGDHSYYPEVTNIDFDGCINSVLMMGAYVQLGRNTKAVGVLPGCPPKFVGMISFSGRPPGYLSWPNVNAEDTLQLSLRFKTNSTPGLIAYIADDTQEETLSLSMVNGSLALRSKNAGVTSHPIQYNDGEWHVVTATYEPSGLQLDVDDRNMFKTSLKPRGASLSIRNGKVYFGGIPGGYSMVQGASGSVVPFSGCLSDATIGGIIVNFANANDRDHVILSKCPSGSEPIDWPNEGTETNIPQPPEDSDNEGDYESPVTWSTPPTSSVPLTPAPTPAGLCALPFSPASDPDLTEESGVRFGSKPFSRYEYQFLLKQVRKGYTFSLDFKTSEPNGTIFFVLSEANSLDHVAVYMKNGKFHYTFNCGSGPALIVSSEEYNDNAWHTLVFSRNGTEGELFIDKVLVGRKDSAGNTKTLNVEPPLYVGGLPKKIQAKDPSLNIVNSLPSFIGCIRGFKMNKKAPAPSRAEGVIPCSDKVESGTFFGPGQSYIKAFDKFRVGRDVEISFEMRPRFTSGLLFAVHGASDYIVLEMVNGTINCTMNNGKKPIFTGFAPKQPHDVCNGQWHKVKVIKKRHSVLLVVNEEFSLPGMGEIGNDSTDTKHPLYIGGHPNATKGVIGAETREQFVGCMRNFMVVRSTGDYPVPLTAANAVGNVISNVCPVI